MGGDHAPGTVIEGAHMAREAYPDVCFRFFGDEAQIAPVLEKFPGLRDSCDLIHTEEAVADVAKPSQMVRRGKKTSMGLALEAVKAGEASVALSAGNTGALMALSKVLLRTMKGIDRPALASMFPTYRGDSIMLDLGANVECSAKNLVQFAIMGAAFARTVLGLDKPKVGLLNVGVEELKGHSIVRNAADQLRDAPLPLDFYGFVEGDSIAMGDCDVVVTDGFTGNVALKTAEGTAKLLAKLLSDAFRSSLSAKLGYLAARSSLKSLKDHMDPNSHNGAVFLGLNGLVVKSHGGASSLGFSSAFGVAADLARANFIQLIAGDLGRLPGGAKPAADAS